jgi:hypothetical protein
LTEKDGCVTGINTSGGAYSTAPGTALDNNYGAGSYGMNVGVRHSF